MSCSSILNTLNSFSQQTSRVSLVNLMLSTVKTDIALPHNQRPLPLVKPLSSYTAMKSAAAVTLDLRDGNTTPWRSDRCFKTQIVLTGLPLHHMSCKVCETLREIAMIGLY